MRRSWGRWFETRGSFHLAKIFGQAVETQMKRANPLEIFQNKPMTFEGTPLFSFQSVGTEVTVLFERSFNFGCSCCKLACIITTHCRLKKVLHSINLLLAKQQKVAAVETEKIVSST